ncbi:hypothetical protein Bbelb_169330, partial [Branchiostoma belcheri]
DLPAGWRELRRRLARRLVDENGGSKHSVSHTDTHTLTAIAYIYFVQWKCAAIFITGETRLICGRCRASLQLGKVAASLAARTHEAESAGVSSSQARATRKGSPCPSCYHPALLFSHFLSSFLKRSKIVILKGKVRANFRGAIASGILSGSITERFHGGAVEEEEEGTSLPTRRGTERDNNRERGKIQTNEDGRSPRQLRD